MTLVKSLLKYFGLFLLVYFTLTGITYIPTVKTAIAPVGIAYTKGVMNTFYSKAYTDIQSSREEPINVYHLIVSFQNQKTVDKAIAEARKQRAPSVKLDTKFFDFFIDIKFLFPFLFIVSLIIITPVPWKRKLLGLAISLALVLVFITIGLCFVTSYNMANADIGIYDLSDSTLALYKKLGTIVNPMTDMTFALLVYLSVFFRKEDFKKAMGSIGA